MGKGNFDKNRKAKVPPGACLPAGRDLGVDFLAKPENRTKKSD